jgi:hypothetical protein
MPLRSEQRRSHVQAMFLENGQNLLTFDNRKYQAVTFFKKQFNPTIYFTVALCVLFEEPQRTLIAKIAFAFCDRIFS